jgi:hypothetical protein
MHDENAYGLAATPERRSGNRPGARGTRWGQTGPIGYRRIDVVDVRKMYLPVFAEHGARQTMAANPELRHGNFGANPLGASARVDDLAPLVTIGDKDRYA